MRRYVFSDEAGDFEFSRKSNVSQYFIACAVALDSCEIGIELLELRRRLLWEGFPINNYFHASEDKQIVRDRVYELLDGHHFQIFVQILEKSKAQPKIRTTNHRFYKHAWYYLFKHAMPEILKEGDELMVTTASVGTRKGQAVFSDAVRDVLKQTVGLAEEAWRTSFCSSASDPCLQVADYCTWAVQRKYERKDDRSYLRLQSKIVYEYDLWKHGQQHYY